MGTARRRRKDLWSGGDPLWYKDAIIYELHVRAFRDANGDGIGDFPGLVEKLDYLQDLGITAIWLLPFYPSPLRDDGYDIADYRAIHPSYGTPRDFSAFMHEASKRGLRVITELVLNHTSDQHAWFQRARRAPRGSRWRDFYVWSETPEKYKQARVIFSDFESSNWSWDPIAKSYYWHRFYSHQPDLNYDSPSVQQAMLQAVDFWLGLGVSGLRLDAVPYLYEREGTNCENLPETHDFLKRLRQRVDERFEGRMLLGEANQWPEDAAAYFGDGDECHMAFHFPLMPRLFMAVRMEDRFPVTDILGQTPQIPEMCQWATFLRNHDELTLEMVTDEERDYMYRVYAHDQHARVNFGIRRRLAPLLDNDRRKMELMNSLLLSLPGTPVIYYGDEIGMGDNFYLGDRNGVRTPMQWSADRNAGFSSANPQSLYLPVIIDPEYHYEALNAEAQQSNPSSILWWMKRLIALRRRHPAFSRGSLEFLQPQNRKVLAFTRQYRQETVLVVANLSRQAQYTTLDLQAYAGMAPVEMLGGSSFPMIGGDPYLVTLTPYGFYWFSLEPPRVELVSLLSGPSEAAIPAVTLSARWDNLTAQDGWTPLETVLVEYTRGQRWFGGKARSAQSWGIQDVVRIPYGDTVAYLVLLRFEYAEGDSETYLLPVAFASGEKGAQILSEFPRAVIARARLQAKSAGIDGVIYDAVLSTGFDNQLLDSIARRRRIAGDSGDVVFSSTRAFRRLRGPADTLLQPSLARGEQSNTSILYGDRLILKLYRRLGEGSNPELEIGRFLSEKMSFSHVAPLAGALEYRARAKGQTTTLAVCHGYVAGAGNAWDYTLDYLGHYFERVLSQFSTLLAPPLDGSILTLSQQTLPETAYEIVGTYLTSARVLGQETGELHLALAMALEDPAFTPEPFSKLYRRSLYQSMRTSAVQGLQTLRERLSQLPDSVRQDAQAVVELESAIVERFRAVSGTEATGMRIRCHGDYHLGQVLYTGKDFVIIDFEGEPARPVSERRLKRSPLRDVAGMIRSFHYASWAALLGQAPTVIRPEDVLLLEPWARLWYMWVSAAFLQSYVEVVGSSGLLPQGREESRILLNAHLLDKAIYELRYELNSRPGWVKVPLQGILHLTGADQE